MKKKKVAKSKEISSDVEEETTDCKILAENKNDNK